MPSRGLTLAIVFFWIGGGVWWFSREIAPWLKTGQPPPYVFDMTDEVRPNEISWAIFQKGEKIGDAYSSIRRNSDRIFELKSDFRFYLNKANFLGMPFKKIYSVLQATPEGNLQGILFQIKIGEISGEVQGEAKGDKLQLTLQIKINNLPLELDKSLAKFQVPLPKRILNPMQLLNRYPGLHDGQSWKEPLFNSMATVVPGRVVDDNLLAQVHSEDLEWQGKPVTCYCIDFFDSKQKRLARTWIRRKDSLVLQQEAHFGVLDMVIQRLPNK